jgi:hypothetical protein
LTSCSHTVRPIQIPSTKFQRISTLLTAEMAYQLYNMLPEAVRLAQPHLVFSTKRFLLPFPPFSSSHLSLSHGWSIENLFAKTHNLDPVIILVRGLKSKSVSLCPSLSLCPSVSLFLSITHSPTSVVIGGFSTSCLSPPTNRIRGSGECFVFRLSPLPGAHYWTYIPSMNKVPPSSLLTPLV